MIPKKNLFVVIGVTFLTILAFSIFGFKKTQKTTTKGNGGNSISLSSNKAPKTETASFTVDQVKKHNSQNDCYLIVKGEVYDVSSYIYQHPGGVRNITSRCGQEVTGIFASIHSNFAWNLLEKYKVGAISDNTLATPSGTSASASETLNKLSDSLKEKYPNANVLSVKPSKDIYIAKLIIGNSLYEIHLDQNGNEIKKEVSNDEFDWSAWDTDKDDL